MFKRFHILFSGAVQGVGFRYTAHSLAKQYDISGWVKNLSDGRVELVAQGQHNTIESFLDALKKEFSGSVRDVTTEEISVVETDADFQIRFH